MRLFLAGALPDGLQSSLFEALGGARRAAAQARWLRPGQLHLTLAFLGEQPETEVPRLLEAVRPVGRRYPPLRLALPGAGCFGRPHAPTVLFAELDGEVAALRALAADLRAALPPGEASPKPFHPHLTLARARARQGDAALCRCRRALRHQALGAFVLERLSLYQSEPFPTGHRYRELAGVPLGDAASAV